MRRLRELLRLKYDAGLPHRAIAQACAVGLGTVTAYLQRATAAGLTWPLPDDLDDAALEARLFARPAAPPARDRASPTWAELHQELKKPGRHARAAVAGVSRARIRTGYAYSQFCERYRQWARVLKPSMRQVHRAGEKLFVDFSGKRPHLVDPHDRRGGRRRALRRRARRQRLDLRRGDARARTCRRGSARTSACWSTFRAVRRSGCPTI